jgi:negative regulator of flagellin synthesis FlgM
MKIGNPNDKTTLNPLAGDRRAEVAQQAKSPKGTAAGEASAQVALSREAAELAAKDPSADFDAAKVERIAQAIAEGKFKVNPELIADKLIASTQELLGHKTH